MLPVSLGVVADCGLFEGIASFIDGTIEVVSTLPAQRSERSSRENGETEKIARRLPTPAGSTRFRRRPWLIEVSVKATGMLRHDGETTWRSWSAARSTGLLL